LIYVNAAPGSFSHDDPMAMGPAPDALPTRVLVIEDDVLTAAGYKVCAASNGDDGLREFVACKPGLVITNRVMPGKHGLDTDC
jgi:hypothetical protein